MTALIIILVLLYIGSKMDVADDIRVTWFEACNGDCVWYGGKQPVAPGQPNYLLVKVSFTSRFLGMVTTGYMGVPEQFMGASPKTQDAVVKATAAKGRISVHEVKSYSIIGGNENEAGA